MVSWHFRLEYHVPHANQHSCSTILTFLKRNQELWKSHQGWVGVFGPLRDSWQRSRIRKPSSLVPFPPCTTKKPNWGGQDTSKPPQKKNKPSVPLPLQLNLGPEKSPRKIVPRLAPKFHRSHRRRRESRLEGLELTASHCHVWLRAAGIGATVPQPGSLCRSWREGFFWLSRRRFLTRRSKKTGRGQIGGAPFLFLGPDLGQVLRVSPVGVNQRNERPTGPLLRDFHSNTLDFGPPLGDLC